MSKGAFLDTSYILALVNAADINHRRALAASQELRPPLITTEAVLVELGNSLSRLRWRELGYDTIQDLRRNARIEVIPVSSKLLARALQMYGDRADKEWGMTDCISFVVMADRRLQFALTFDKHFQQAGFLTLA